MLSKIRTLASDTLIYGAFNIIGRFLNFLIIPFYTNFLRSDELGEISFFSSIIAFVNIVYSFGMESAYFRFYTKEDLGQCKKVFTHSFVSIAIISGTASIMIFLSADILGPITTNLDNSGDIIRIIALIPFFDAMMLVPYALLRMERKAKRFAYTRFLLIIIFLICNIVLVVGFDLGIQGFFGANLIASFIGVILFSRIIFGQLNFSFDKALFKKMLRFGLPTVPAGFAAIALQTADKPIVKALAGASQNGIYSVNYKLGIPMMIFVSIFEYAWKPFYLNHYEEPDAKRMFARVLTYFTMICSGIFLLVGLFVDFIVRIPSVNGTFVNESYWHALGIVPIILGGYFFNGVFNNFAAGIQIMKKTEYFPIAVGIAAAINIGMNFILVPIEGIGIWGAAWATLVAYAVSAVVLYIFSNKVYPIKYEWKRIILIIVMTVVVFFGAKAITAGMEQWPSFLIRTGAIILMLILMWVFKFFTSGEIAGMKKLFRARKA